jgi:hypothetical protein
MSRLNLKGRASLLALCAALADGCRSELELWGLRHVFRDDPRFAHGIRQLPVRLASGTAYLDLAFVPERVAVELDGAAITLCHSIENETCVVTPLSARSGGL